MKKFKEIFESASKIVFITMALGAFIGLFTGHITSDDFMVLAGMAFGFYFSYKGDPNKEYNGK